MQLVSKITEKGNLKKKKKRLWVKCVFISSLAVKSNLGLPGIRFPNVLALSPLLHQTLGAWPWL